MVFNILYFPFVNTRGFLRSKGFTLIEVLITLVILSSAVLMVSRIWSGNHQRVKKGVMYNKVHLLMQKKISELEFNWQKLSFSSIPKEAKGEFEGEEHFSWSVATQPLSLPDPDSFLQVAGQEGMAKQGMAQQVAKVTTQFLSQAVLEVKLTIYYKRGKLKSAYSLTTYVVDHNKQIQFSGGL